MTDSNIEDAWITVHLKIDDGMPRAFDADGNEITFDEKEIND